MHLKVDVMAREYVAEGLLEALRDYDMTGAEVLIARAAVARDTLPAELTRRGARVDVAEAYRTVAPSDLAQRIADVLKDRPDWITFTSSSTVSNFLEAAGGPQALEGIRVASIGPITSTTLRAQGVAIAAEAVRYTVEGLIEPSFKPIRQTASGAEVSKKLDLTAPFRHSVENQSAGEHDQGVDGESGRKDRGGKPWHQSRLDESPDDRIRQNRRYSEAQQTQNAEETQRLLIPEQCQNHP